VAGFTPVSALGESRSGIRRDDPGGPTLTKDRAARPGHGRHAAGRHTARDVLVVYRYPLLLWAGVNVAIVVSGRLLPAVQRRTVSYVHGDSTLYLQIAQHGYALHGCPSAPPFPHGSWCGNTAWQPLYPWLIKAVSVSGISVRAAGLGLSELCALAVFVLLWSMVRTARHPYAVLLCAAVFPGVVYVFGLFPISLVLLLALMLFRLLERRAYLWALVPAFLFPLAYSSAIAVVLVLGLWWLVFRRLDEWRAGALLVAAAVAGYALFLAVLQVSAGRWNAGFLASSKYGNGIHDPVHTLVVLIWPAAGTPDPNVLPSSHTGIVPWETLLVLFLIGLVTFVVCRHRTELTTLDQLVACWTYVFWLVPLVIGLGVSSYRAHALLLPAVVLLRYLSRPVLVLVVLLSAPIAYVLTTQVLTGQLL
jgi:hypothetical protein